jgi:hypothetical protein
MKKTILTLIMIIILTGCGKLTNDKDYGKEQPITTPPTEGILTEISKIKVNQISVVNDQKNPNIMRYNDLILVLYVDEKSYKINACTYNLSMVKLKEIALNLQNGVTVKC